MTARAEARDRAQEVEPAIWPDGAAFVDGAYVPIAEARIPILDWGFLRSDCTYDVVHVWGGRFFRLDHHLDRMVEDHERARLIAEACGVDPATVPTNIVVVDVPSAPEVVAAAAGQGVRIGAVGPQRVRLLTHLDITREDAEQAAKVLAGLLG